MEITVRSPTSIVWLTLVLATVVSWILGAGHGFGNGSPAGASVVILLVAMFKIRLIGLYFMELREAPRMLCGLFEFYCVALGTLMIGMFLLV